MISACLNCFAELKLDEYDEYLLTVLDNEKGIYDFKTKQNYPLKKKILQKAKKQKPQITTTKKKPQPAHWMLVYRMFWNLRFI